MNQQSITTPDDFTASDPQLVRLKRILGSEALLKATYDPFDYALKLRSGEVIPFTSAKVISDEWVHLTVSDYHKTNHALPLPAARGIDVRIPDIVWVMDAPSGS